MLCGLFSSCFVCKTEVMSQWVWRNQFIRKKFPCQFRLKVIAEKIQGERIQIVYAVCWFVVQILVFTWGTLEWRNSYSREGEKQTHEESRIRLVINAYFFQKCKLIYTEFAIKKKVKTENERYTHNVVQRHINDVCGTKQQPKFPWANYQCCFFLSLFRWTCMCILFLGIS